ncbi:porphobilinogen deaminase [Xylaria bambusicola]|uniref:porphobilinogen deaminase n=1 Tax=Xylaria bambusicola TaxID=326684 RepID=UPI002008AB0B|nr:porphobilinogen deaminase [Xylaria bambusicola]KAI0517609.1 porphobilinogen deaminase [Xylaria bambusicola]
MSTSATQPVITPSGGNTQRPVVRVGSRKSALAMLQAEWVVASLKKLHPDVDFEVRGMLSTADKDKITALYKFGGKGLWTNELEAALLANELDMIVHCAKDMPTSVPEGCTLACFTEREDPRDVVVVKKGLEEKYKTLANLPDGAVVGTSSVRRMAQIRRRYPRLRFQDMRGNIDTRLQKLDAADSEYSVLILAAAGLHRTSRHARIAQYLDRDTEGGGMLYAVGQGGLALETRADDTRTLELLRPFEDEKTMLAIETERSIMRTLEGGCSIPIGVETAWLEGDKLRLTGCVVSIEGTEAADAESVEEVTTREQAVAFGKRVAQMLVDNGAQSILDVINADREASRDKAEPWVPA